MKILLCEDDINIATIAKLALQQIGKHELDHATDGAISLEKAKTGVYDVILLDEMMPKMNGIDVCRELIKNPEFKTPIIFMSANPQEQRVLEFQPIAIGFIPKPFDPMSLNEQIQTLVASKKAAS